MGKFEIKTQNDDQFYFVLKSGNGEIILTSEAYVSKAGCNSGIESVIKNSQINESFEKKISKNRKYYFNLKASNGQVIGVSEMYETEAARDNGIFSVQKNAKDAEIISIS